MKNLLHLLERFSNSLHKDTLIKERIAETIFTYTKVKITNDKLLLKEGVLELEASAVVKNEIKLKEESIKTELKERFRINITRVLYK